MYCFKSYLFIVVLIFVEKVASKCVDELDEVFNRNRNFVGSYQFAYPNLTMQEICDWTTKFGFEEGIRNGSDYCNDIAIKKARQGVERQSTEGSSHANDAAGPVLQEIARYSVQGKQRPGSRSNSNIRVYESIVTRYKGECEQELKKYNFSLNNNKSSFMQAFLYQNDKSFTHNGVVDTYARGYFEDIFPKTRPIQGAYDIVDWCRNELNKERRRRNH